LRESAKTAHFIFIILVSQPARLSRREKPTIPGETTMKFAPMTRLALLALTSALALAACDGGGSSGPSEDPVRKALIDTGSVIFEGNCAGCHGPGGNGHGHGAPQIANSNFVMGPKTRLIKTVLYGNQDSLRVNGVFYAGGGMGEWGSSYTNYEVAGILTYVRSVLNDTLYTDCVNQPVGETTISCTKTARPAAERIADIIVEAEVKAVRDSIDALAR
jgi:mono/diheme cytochrome c family protein